MILGCSPWSVSTPTTQYLFRIVTPLLCCIPNFFLIICLYGCFSVPFPLLWAIDLPPDGFSAGSQMTVTFQTAFYEQTYGCSVFFSL